MRRRKVSGDAFVDVAASGQRGVARWTSAAELHEQERRWWWIAGAIGSASVIWLIALPALGAPGVLLLEALTAIPAGFTIARLWDLHRLHRHAGRRIDTQIEAIVDKQETDRLLAKIGRLVDELPRTLRSDGRESFRVAARASSERQRLLDRAVDLRTILDDARGERTIRELRERLRTTEQDSERLHFKLERLTLALAELVDASDDDDLSYVHGAVQESEERLHALAEALVELRQEGHAG